MDLLQTICRICESQDNLCDLTNKLNESVSEKLASLTTIRIQPDDPLPRCICVECVNTLNIAYEFLLRCEAAEQRLQEEFQQQQQLKADAVPLDGNDVDLLIEEVLVDKDIEGTVEYVVELHGEDNPQEVDHNVDELVEQSDEEASTAGQEEVVGIYTEQNLDGTENDVKIFYGGVPIKYAIEGMLEENALEDQQQGAEFSLKQDEEVGFLEQQEAIQQQRYDRDKKFHCGTCEASFDKCTDLYQHVKTHGKARYQCKDCDRWFSRRQHLYSHEVIHTGERNFRCQSCPNSYTSNRNLRRHIKSAHLGEKPFVCDLCGKEFSQKTVLEAHHSTHIQERNFGCDVCLKTFKSKKLLKLHVSRHLRPEQQPAVKQEPEPLECDVCHKFYSTKLSLRSHKQVHSDAKIMCSFCGKSFKIMTHLKVHLRSHTKEQPYECKECHKKFGYESSLKSHLLLHTNERPYKCDICNVSFRQLNHLKGHKFLHSGEKPFTCVVCNKAFALRGNLTIHMRIHGGPGSSPFQCRMCEGKRLNDSNALKRHLKVHPGGKVIKSGSLTVIVAEAEPSGEEDAEEEEEEEDDGGADDGFFVGRDALDVAGIGIEGALLS